MGLASKLASWASRNVAHELKWRGMIGAGCDRGGVYKAFRWVVSLYFIVNIK